MNAIKLLLLILAAMLAQRFVDWPFLQPVTFALIGLLIVSFVWSRLACAGSAWCARWRRIESRSGKPFVTV